MSAVPAIGTLRSLREHPYELLRELERRSKVAAAGMRGEDISGEEWVGIGFRLGGDRFVVDRAEVKEVLMVPPAITRVPGAKAWIRGLANVRGHLLPLVTLRDFLGGGGGADRTARVLVANAPDVPVGLIVDEVYGFRRFLDRERSAEEPSTLVRCERFVQGLFRRGEETWPVFSVGRLLEDRDFQRAAAE